MLATPKGERSRLFVLRRDRFPGSWRSPSLSASRPKIRPYRDIVTRWTRLRRRLGGGSRGEVGLLESVVRAAHGVVGHNAHRRGPVLPSLIRRPVVRVSRWDRGDLQDNSGPDRGLLLHPRRLQHLAGSEGLFAKRGVGEAGEHGFHRGRLASYRPPSGGQVPAARGVASRTLTTTRPTSSGPSRTFCTEVSMSRQPPVASLKRSSVLSEAPGLSITSEIMASARGKSSSCTSSRTSLQKISRGG